VFAFVGRRDTGSIGALWRPAIRAAEQARGGSLVPDLSKVSFCDVGGASFLAAIETAHGEAAEIVGGDQRATALLRRARTAARPSPFLRGTTAATAARTLSDLAGAVLGLLVASIGFIGEAAVAVVRLPRRRRMLRVPDLLRYIDTAGLRSLPLLVMLGFLIGMILAFQSAVPMRRFGADIFVANLRAISLLGELGPLLAAVMLAGRTGSAFANCAQQRHARGGEGADPQPPVAPASPDRHRRDSQSWVFATSASLTERVTVRCVALLNLARGPSWSLCPPFESCGFPVTTRGRRRAHRFGGKHTDRNCANALARWLTECLSIASSSPNVTVSPAGMKIGS